MKPWEKYQTENPVQKPWEKEPSKMGRGEALARGAGQGLFGFGDEIEAAARAAYDASTGGAEKGLWQAYMDRLGQARSANDKAWEDRPAAYGTGNVGATVGTAFIPGLNLAKGASLWRQALAAAASGGLYGAGTSEAKNLKDFGTDVALGAGGSAALTGLGGVAVKGSKAAGRALRKGAEKMATVATGATGKQIQEKFGKEAGEFLLDSGVVNVLSSPGSIAKRMENMMDKSGAQIGQVLDTLDDMGAGIPKKDVYASIMKRAAEMKSKGGAQVPAARRLEKIAENYLDDAVQEVMPISNVELDKRTFQQAVNYLAKTQKPNTTQAKDAAANTLMEMVENAATKFSPGDGDNFRMAKKLYGIAKPIKEAAEQRAYQLSRHPMLGLKDIAGGTGVGALYALSDGNPDDVWKTAALGGAGARFLGPRIPSILASGMNRGSHLLQSPQALSPWVNVLRQGLASGVGQNIQ